MLRKNPRKVGGIVDGRKGLGFWVLLLNLSKFSFSLSLLSLPRGTVVQISPHLSQCVECKHTNVSLKKCARMTLRSREWWLQGCVLSLVGCCRLLWGWWVSGLLHCWGYRSKVFWPFSSWERINFLGFVDMTLRSLDFGHEDGSYIHEFIWYQKEKKSGRSCLSLPSYGWILHALFTNATKNCTCNWKLITVLQSFKTLGGIPKQCVLQVHSSKPTEFRSVLSHYLCIFRSIVSLASCMCFIDKVYLRMWRTHIIDSSREPNLPINV